MVTRVKKTETSTQWYAIPYPATAYTFPQNALIHTVHFDVQHIHFELVDGRVVSVPLTWIPTLYNAQPEERLKFQVSRDRKMVIWDPDFCAINDEIRIDDYLAARVR